MGVRLLAYTGVLKIGASRSSSLQSISPLIAATIAIMILKEPAGSLIIAGTLLVVCGVVLVSWKAERELPSFRWWHLLLPIGAACLTGINHPLRRYAFGISDEPLFFSAFMGLVSLCGFLIYRAVSPQKQRMEFNAGARWPFLCTGIFETLSIVLIMTSLSLGRVVVVAPIAATYPVWALIGAKLFLRNVEKITLKTAIGILSVVAGTVAIHLGR
jgi:drug/metabolite transporter (DMT)-like permease